MQKVRNLPLLLLGALLSLSALVMAGDRLYSPPDLPKPKDGVVQCVEPKDTMRRDHMRMIEHQRDDTMYRGIRTSKYSLVECINCHVQADATGNYPHAGTRQHFCTHCHEYAAVKIDCFQCHASQHEGVGHE
jgi:hypothetical protein